MLQFFIDRLKERSTWIGITAVATAAGVSFEPELQEAIIVAGLAFAGLIAAITKDKK